MSKVQNMSVQSFIRNETTQKRINDLIGSRTPQLTTSLMTALNSNDKLAQCTPTSVLNAALTAASMDLPINPNLGFAYIIPYERKFKEKDENNRDVWVTVSEAQFQIGYKGIIQLAQRSGFYKTINASDVREGEIKGRNRLTGEIEFDWIEDTDERNNKPIIGFVGYLGLTSGFEKTLYMSLAEIEAHAMEYSKSYAYDKQKGYTNSNWTTNFSAMAIKTVLKLLISKYGPMNTQMQEAIIKDQAVIDGDAVVYPDNDKPDFKLLTPAEKTMTRHTGWINKRFNDLGYTSELERKGFIKTVLKKETFDTPQEAEEVTEALNLEEESRQPA